MPIKLTKPFNPGDADPKAGNGYEFAQLTGFTHNGITMAVAIEYEYGTASGDYYQFWERGPGSVTQQAFVMGSEVAKLWSDMPLKDECIGAAIRRATYQFLIDSGKCPGTIVDNPPLPPEEAKPEPSEEPAAPPADGPAPSTDETPAPAEEPAPEETPAPEPDSGTNPDDSGTTPEAPAEETPAPADENTSV